VTATHVGYIPPPSAGDILLAVGAYGWLRLTLPDGRVLEGEKLWREAVESADPDERSAIWQALHDADTPDRTAVRSAGADVEAEEFKDPDRPVLVPSARAVRLISDEAEAFEEPLEDPDDDWLRSAIEHSTVDRLIASLPEEPLPGQQRLVLHAVEVARWHLALPPRLVFRWRAAGRDSGICGGATVRQGKEIAVYLNADAMPGDLVRTTYHELQHVADFASARGRAFGRVELEKRAVAFAAEMMMRNPACS
jgi:hypothetical protein